jgi:hypothetical protein
LIETIKFDSKSQEASMKFNKERRNDNTTQKYFFQDLHSLPFISQSAEIQESEVPIEQRILLVCIINYKRINITFDYLYNLFCSYGEVKKILFFEKTLTWKAFVEMGTSSQATKARDTLNNMNLFNDGSKMNIYLSNLKELVLPKNLMNGRDFTKHQEPAISSLTLIPESDQLQNVFKSFSLQDIKLMEENSQTPNSFFKRNNILMDNLDTNTYNYKSLASIQEKDEDAPKKTMHREHSIDDLLAAKTPNPHVFNLAEPPGLSKSINYQKQTGCLKSAELSSKRNSATTAGTAQSPINFLNGGILNIPLKSSPQIPSFSSSAMLNLNNALSPSNINHNNNSALNENNKIGTPNSACNFNVFAGEASRVLFVKGLEDSKLKVQVLYNLFSNFGNITKIIFMRNKSGALIEFQSIEYATIAKDFLNNLNFFSSYLRISYSNYQEIVLKNINFGDLKEDILICDENLMRFKKNKNILINPPSNVIHLSNLSKEACQEDKIREFLDGLGNIEKIKFLIQENQKTCVW